MHGGEHSLLKFDAHQQWQVPSCVCLLKLCQAQHQRHEAEHLIASANTNDGQLCVYTSYDRARGVMQVTGAVKLHSRHKGKCALRGWLAEDLAGR